VCGKKGVSRTSSYRLRLCREDTGDEG
jgi:hypothetical protein